MAIKHSSEEGYYLRSAGRGFRGFNSCVAVQAGASHLPGCWGRGKPIPGVAAFFVQPRAARPRGLLLSPPPGFVPLLPGARGCKSAMAQGESRGGCLPSALGRWSLRGQKRSKEVRSIVQGTSPAIKPGLLKGAEEPARGAWGGLALRQQTGGQSSRLSSTPALCGLEQGA